MDQDEPPYGFRHWLLRYFSESAHEIAVKTTAHVVVPVLVALIMGILTQIQFDWFGKSRTAIGEWTTTVKLGPRQ